MDAEMLLYILVLLEEHKGVLVKEFNGIVHHKSLLSMLYECFS